MKWILLEERDRIKCDTGSLDIIFIGANEQNFIFEKPTHYRTLLYTIFRLFAVVIETRISKTCEIGPRMSPFQQKMRCPLRFLSLSSWSCVIIITLWQKPNNSALTCPKKVRLHVIYFSTPEENFSTSLYAQFICIYSSEHLELRENYLIDLLLLQNLRELFKECGRRQQKTVQNSNSTNEK